MTALILILVIYLMIGVVVVGSDYEHSKTISGHPPDWHALEIMKKVILWPASNL